jgi:hypothetical protein
MNRLTQLLADAGREWEPELQRRLGGLLGGIFRAYLPQTWVFRAGEDTATLRVGPDGDVVVTDGVSKGADVTVEVPYERLATALKQRTRDAVPSNELHVVTHTSKGKAAFDFLRGRLGL